MPRTKLYEMPRERSLDIEMVGFLMHRRGRVT